MAHEDPALQHSRTSQILVPFHRQGMPDFFLLLPIGLLLALGVVMVYSATYYISMINYDDPTYYLKRELLWVALGVVVMLLMMRIDYHRLRRFANIALLIAVALLTLVVLPGLGTISHGSQQWIAIGGFTFQPSELAKLCMILYLAAVLEKKGGQLHSFAHGFLPPLLVVTLLFVLIMLEPDLGTGVVLMATGLIVLFAAGVRLRHLATVLIPVPLAFLALAFSSSYRKERIFAFLDPWKDPLGNGWNLIQSYFALGHGGLFGQGLGQGFEKFFYLPEPQSDFIFSVLGEELGFIGTSATLLLYGLLLWRGLRAAMLAPDVFGTLLATGVCAMIGVQVIVNVAVATGVFPITGITLPLLSYGGTSLVVILAGLGVVLNISRQARIYGGQGEG